VLGVQFHPEVTADSFDSWLERWAAEGEALAAVPDLDLRGLRAAVVRHERDGVILCDRLIGTFCARNVGD
jgi:hypothetical protein